MPAPTARCAGCEVVLGPEEQHLDGHCAECAEIFCPSLLDDPDLSECSSCGEELMAEHLDEEGRCDTCIDAEDYVHQVRGDYRAMCC